MLFVARRLLITIPVLLTLSVFVFLLIHLVPGDPVQTMLGFRATPENVATIRADLGLDRSLLAQYASWLGGLLHGDFGRDYVSGAPLSSLLATALPVTLELTLLAMMLATFTGVPLGVFAASRGASWRIAGEGFVIAGISIPDFWLGIMLVLLFAGTLGWLPPSGYVPIHEGLVDNLRYMVLPVLTLAIGEAAYIARTTRSAVEDALTKPFAGYLRAKGVTESQPRLPPRPAQRRRARRHGRRHPVRRAARRLDRHRVRLRTARPRAHDRRRHQPAQLHRRAGRRARRWRRCSSP